MSNRSKMLARMEQREAKRLEVVRGRAIGLDKTTFTEEETAAFLAFMEQANVKREEKRTVRMIPESTPRQQAMQRQREQQSSDGHEHPVQERTIFVDYYDW